MRAGVCLCTTCVVSWPLKCKHVSVVSWHRLTYDWPTASAREILEGPGASNKFEKIGSVTTGHGYHFKPYLYLASFLTTFFFNLFVHFFSDSIFSCFHPLLLQHYLFEKVMCLEMWHATNPASQSAQQIRPHQQAKCPRHSNKSVQVCFGFLFFNLSLQFLSSFMSKVSEWFFHTWISGNKLVDHLPRTIQQSCETAPMDEPWQRMLVAQKSFVCTITVQTC